MPNAFARSLRKHETNAERLLWRRLRELKKGNLHFRRQAPFGRYVVDFACHRAKVIVELDGDQHGADKQAEYDEERTKYLQSRGYRVLRFANWEVLKERQRVLDYILHVTTTPHPDRR